MSQERRFDEKEIVAIFKHAAKEQETLQIKQPLSVGLSLEELQKIGAESGIAPEFIARAVAAIDHKDGLPEPQKFLGISISASKTVELPRKLNDEEWEQLIVDLRATFKAKGDIEKDGSVWQWTDGNLSVFIEPSEPGFRLRMEATKSTAKAGLGGGLFCFILGMLILQATSGTGSIGDVIEGLTTVLILIGLGSFGGFAFSLPRWAKLRERQIETIAARLITRMGGSNQEEVPLEVQRSPQLSLEELTDPVKEEAEQEKKQKLRL